MYARTAPATFAFIPARPVRPSIGTWLNLVWRTAQTRRDLAAMDGRMLADIGVTHTTAQAEAARPAWDTACRSW